MGTDYSKRGVLVGNPQIMVPRPDQSRGRSVDRGLLPRRIGDRLFDGRT
ncbi:hypothetical protein [Alloactinosynnema sp. L-07]|nr:hypothetical protein [Alloactinosynnema sp. L-07]